jgi:hypothetical protein
MRCIKESSPIINPNPVYSHSYTWQYKANAVFIEFKIRGNLNLV